MLDLIGHALSQCSIGFLRFDGSLSERKRHQVLSEFDSKEIPSVLLMSLKAGGVGLNLTRASNVILVDSWWNPAVDNQAIDRIHRIGQTRSVTVRRLVIKGTIEERILELQERKSELARGVLSREDHKKEMRLDDLKMLFSGFE